VSKTNQKFYGYRDCSTLVFRNYYLELEIFSPRPHEYDLRSPLTLGKDSTTIAIIQNNTDIACRRYDRILRGDFVNHGILDAQLMSGLNRAGALDSRRTPTKDFRRSKYYMRVPKYKNV
jgi:hypothetical protein